MFRKKHKVRIGDVLEIATPAGLAYLQYSHDSPSYGPLLRVLPGFYRSRPNSVEEVVEQQELYYVHYALSAALSEKMVTVVAHVPVPERAREFPIMREAGEIDRQGRVLNWWILYSPDRYLLVRTLTPEQKLLSIAEIWSHAQLVERLAAGWTPPYDAETWTGEPDFGDEPASGADQPVGDALAIDTFLRAGGQPDVPHTVAHYLYFPSEAAALEVSRRLEEDGYQTEVQLGADDVNWLCLATHFIVLTEETITGLRERLETLARDFGGEYDGWEAAING